MLQGAWQALAEQAAVLASGPDLYAIRTQYAAGSLASTGQAGQALMGGFRA